MGDDLAAFFAKKVQKKSKKKNIVSLDDVGQQLERRLRIQENEECELDESETKETKSSENVKVTQNSEDSEWIEHTEKPSLVGLTFKEFTENPDELLEEDKKRANNGSAKTWQMKSEVPVIEGPKPVQPKTYQAPFARRDARLDITNEEMFPSIAAADEIVDKLKAEEKKKVAVAAHPAEEHFQEAKKFRPRALDESSASRNTSTTGSNYRSDIVSSERTNWRSKSTAPIQQFKTNETLPQEDSGNWRSAKPSAQTVLTNTNKVSQQAAPSKGKYVPPSLRGKT